MESIKNIPGDLNAEVLLNHYPDETFDVEFHGEHSRNAYKDIQNIDVRKKRLQLILGRNSLYNTLPEYLFHPIDRFENISVKKEALAAEHSRQEEEEDNAYRFFNLFDILLLRLRTKVRKSLLKYTTEDKIMQDIIGDCLTDTQRNNRFIKRTLPYLPTCKNIRGDRTLMTLMMRKVFKDEDIAIEIGTGEKTFRDQHPRYDDIIGSPVGEMFVGYGYNDNFLLYNIYYWSDDDCDEHFLSFVNEVEEYRLFVQDFFLSVDAILQFNIQKDAPTLRLSDTKTYNYLDFNTNL